MGGGNLVAFIQRSSVGRVMLNASQSSGARTNCIEGNLLSKGTTSRVCELASVSRAVKRCRFVTRYSHIKLAGIKNVITNDAFRHVVTVAAFVQRSFGELEKAYKIKCR
jgi:PHP family Zn ribbon phosphoesterase